MIQTLDSTPPLAARDLRGFTAAAEKRLLVRIARTMPAWISPDHLTALGAAAMAGAGLFYRLTPFTPWALLGVNACLFLNWFGDSLDGTLARVREKQRPRYGFYLDHLVDGFGAAMLCVGLGLSGLVPLTLALALLTVYLLFQTHIALKAHTTAVFSMSFAGVGGTELRIALATLNVLALLAPGVPWLMVATMAATLGLLATLLRDATTTARALDREERARWGAC